MFEMKFVWKTLKGKRAMFIIGMLLTVLTSAVVIINPYLTKILVDEVIIGQQTDRLIPVLLIMCGVVLFKTLIFMVKVVLMEISSQTMLMNIRQKIFNNIQFQEMKYFDRMRSGDIITRTTGDLEYMRHFVAYVGYNIVDMVVTFVAAVVMLLFVSVPLTLALLAVLPFIVLTSVIYSKKVFPIFRSIREKLSNLNIAGTENINGNRVVKAFAREDFEREKFAVHSKAFKDENMRASYAWQSIVPIIEFLAQSLSFITLLVGGLLVIKGNADPSFPYGITLGELTLFTSLTWALSDPMRRICPLLNDLQRFWASTDKVIEIYYDTPIICDRADAIDKLDRFDGKVEFRNVSFKYKNEPVLRDVSFCIEAGQTVGIIGPTGAGKSTIASLIARFYEPDEGEILLDDRSLLGYTLQSIHRAVSIATQEVFLFSDTVDSNIAFSDVDMEEEQVFECARLACADKFIRKMPEGYGTIVGERGVGLSGGQRQRIALARAIAAIPSVLILDDTTSAVDMETEKKMQYNLKNLPFDCTKIIIAQRISSIRNADQIFVVEDGRIDVGTHESLMRTNRYYREVCSLQDEKDMPPFEGEEGQVNG